MILNFLIILLVLQVLLTMKRTVLYRTTVEHIDNTNFKNRNADVVLDIKRKEKYLTRYTLINTMFGSIKIHVVHLSDTGDLHDHPWSYMSIILYGGYWEWVRTHKLSEEVFNWMNQVNAIISKYNKHKVIENKETMTMDLGTWYKPGSILFRKANKPHKLEIPEGKKCISLIFTSYKWRDWGFTKNGEWQRGEDNSY